MSVVTAIAATGLAISATGAGMSFSAAAKAKKRAAKAAREQKKLMASAKKRAEKNFYAGLNVPLDAFDEQYRQNIAANQQMMQQLQEGDPRNLAAGVGALGQATAEANEMTRIGMQKDLYENAKMKADAAETMKQQFIDMDVGAAADEAMRERDLQKERAQHVASGVSNLGSAASQASSMVPLFGASGDAKAAGEAYDAAIDTEVEGVPGATVIQENPDTGAINVYNPTAKNPNYDPNLPASASNKELGVYEPIQVGGVNASKKQVIKMMQQRGLGRKGVRQLRRGKYDLSQIGGQGTGGWSDYNWDFLYN